MVRKTFKRGGVSYAYYVCSKHRADKDVCSTHTISFDQCENAVLCALRTHASSILDIERALSYAENMAYTQASIRKLTARLEAKRDEIKKYSEYRLSVHESYIDGIIPKEDFISFRASYDTRITEAEAAAQMLSEEIEQLVAGEAENHEWTQKFKAFADAKVLDRRSTVELVDCVKVYEGSRIEIMFRYQNEYERLKGVV